MVAETIKFEFGIGILEKTEPVQVLFSQNDPLCVEIRNLPMNLAIDEISQRLHNIKVASSKVDQLSKDIREANRQIEDFARNTVLQNTSLHDHLSIMEEVHRISLDDPFFKKNLQIEFDFLMGSSKEKVIFPSIVFSNDWMSSVRLLILYCQTNKPSNKIDSLREKIIDRFGIDAFAALLRLEELNIVSINSKSNWKSNSYAFRLLVQEPKKSELVYGGFVPLISRIIQQIVIGQWKYVKDKLNACNIPISEVLSPVKEIQRICVVFVGGAMFGELAVLRTLAKEINIPIDVLSTELFSTHVILKDLINPN